MKTEGGHSSNKVRQIWIWSAFPSLHFFQGREKQKGQCKEEKNRVEEEQNRLFFFFKETGVEEEEKWRKIGGRTWKLRMKSYATYGENVWEGGKKMGKVKRKRTKG